MEHRLDARLAAWLVRPFVHTPVSPNFFTTLRLGTGLASAWLFARGDTPNTAAWLFVLSNFLDHTDGELARMSGKGSRFGHLYDLACDALVTVLIFVGIGVGLSRHSTPASGWWLGILAGISIALIFHLRYVMEKRAGKAATQQPRLGVFEAEDILYLLPLVTHTNSLPGFLKAAAIGAPLVAIFVISQFLTLQRRAA